MRGYLPSHIEDHSRQEEKFETKYIILAVPGLVRLRLLGTPSYLSALQLEFFDHEDIPHTIDTILLKQYCATARLGYQYAWTSQEVYEEI